MCQRHVQPYPLQTRLQRDKNEILAESRSRTEDTVHTCTSFFVPSRSTLSMNCSNCSLGKSLWAQFSIFCMSSRRSSAWTQTLVTMRNNRGLWDSWQRYLVSFAFEADVIKQGSQGWKSSLRCQPAGEQGRPSGETKHTSASSLVRVRAPTALL